MNRRPAWLTAFALAGGVALTTTTSLVAAEEASDGVGAAPLSGPEVTLAETLYREGRKLMADQRYAEACAKFAESHRLDPATGTLLNLATCHEAQGKLASAWLAFSEAARAARREQREDRQKFAEDHLRAIEPRLSRLTVDVPTSASIEGLTVKLDGVAIGPAAYGVAVPIDPGTHRLEATAPGREGWSAEVVVGGDADHEIVTVPVLGSETRAPESPFGPEAPHASPLAATRAETAPYPGDRGERASRPIPASVYASGAATLALTGGAVVTALKYVQRNEDYEAVRNDASSAQADKREARNDARTFGWLNVAFTAGALVGAGVTVLLYTTRPEAPVASARLSAWAAPNQGGLSLTSEF